MRISSAKVILSLVFIFFGSVIAFSYQNEYKFKDYAPISFRNNSSDWHNRNDHLIPNEVEAYAVLSLDQERDFSGKDIDYDGVPNQLDPSPYDWREAGYQPFGVLEFLSWRHPWNNYKYDEKSLIKLVKLMKEAGVGFVRMDFLWEDIEPARGSFDFKKYDYIVNLLYNENIRILAILDYTASWTGAKWNNPPPRTQDFVNFLSEVVKRYKDKIKYWEIWNEPNSTTYWDPQDEMVGYTNLLKACYIRVKQIDASSKIVLGGMTSEGYYSIKNVYKNGGKDYFDVINMHPFVNPLVSGDIKRVNSIYNNLVKLKAEYGDEDKSIWFTEIGCPGVKKIKESKGWWNGKSPNEKEQAQFLHSIYTDVIKLPDVDKVFWAFFRDNKDHFKNDVDYFGLVRWDFSKKPGFGAYKDRYNNWKKHYKASY